MHERPSGRTVALRILRVGVLVAALTWGFTAYFRPDLLLAFATWVRSCF